MNTKDAVRQRRQDKIRRLLEQQQAAERNKERNGREPRRYSQYLYPGEEPEDLQAYGRNDTLAIEEAEEPDPEKMWKASPNPWLGAWGREGSGYGDRYDPPGPVRHPQQGAFWRGMRWKLGVALLMFGAVWAVFHTDKPWAEDSRQFIKEAMTEPMDFAATAAWYRETFAGAPSFIPIFEEHEQPAELVDGTVKMPVVAPLESGILVKTFAELLGGIELAGTSGEQVVAVQTGRVSQVTNGGSADGGMTVMIQHADGRMTVYGKLAVVSVQKDDWVEAGNPIGKLQTVTGEEPSLLYFAVKQDDRYVDPAEVIPLD